MSIVENWLSLSLIAPVLLSIVYYVDKYVVEHKVKDYRGMPIFGSVAALVFGTIFWVANGFPLLPAKEAILIIFTGMLTIWGYALYFNALSKSQASYIISLNQLTPVFTLILSIIFLGELISLPMFIGFTLILFAATALSFKKEKGKFHLDSAFYAIVLSNIFFAIANIIIKFAFSANSFTTIFAYESLGITLGGIVLLLLFRSVRKAFFHTFQSVGKSVLSIVLLNELVFIISKACTFLAIALGPVALVSVLSSTSVFYGIIIGWTLTLLAPKIFKEDVTTKGLARKFFYMTLIFLGIWLIQF